MSRDIDARDPAEQPGAERQEQAPKRARTDREHAPKGIPESSRAPQRDGRELSRELRDRNREGRDNYVLNGTERGTMREIGRFRVLDAADLARFKYKDAEHLLTLDLKHLKKEGLVQVKTVWAGRDGEKTRYVALTKAGKKALKRDPERVPGQAIYAGLVKPAELRHDAAIYPMYQKEAARLTAEGNQVRRVVLDYELKKKAYSPLAKAKVLPAAEFAKRQAEIAKAFDLKIVNGHLVLPDLRIEYETRTGVAAHIDLELATESYHGSHAAEKAAAGLRIYAAPDTAARLSAALDEREITAEIFAL